jgi:hypothetical protein
VTVVRESLVLDVESKSSAIAIVIDKAYVTPVKTGAYEECGACF